MNVQLIGAPHADWGEEVVAFIVRQDWLSALISEQELDRLCLDNIARFKRPKRYAFVDSLPKNNYGKVLKTELRDWDRRQARRHRLRGHRRSGVPLARFLVRGANTMTK